MRNEVNAAVYRYFYHIFLLDGFFKMKGLI